MVQWSGDDSFRARQCACPRYQVCRGCGFDSLQGLGYSCKLRHHRANPSTRCVFESGCAAITGHYGICLDCRSKVTPSCVKPSYFPKHMTTVSILTRHSYCSRLLQAILATNGHTPFVWQRCTTHGKVEPRVGAALSTPPPPASSGLINKFGKIQVAPPFHRPRVLKGCFCRE